MSELLLTSVAISKTLPLQKIADYFKLQKPLSWKDYILIQGQHLEMILKYDSAEKSVFVFDFGAITFVNLKLHEIRWVMDYLQSIIGKITYNPFTDSLEGHTLLFDDHGMCRLWPTNEKWIPNQKYIIPLTAEVLAQSVAMEDIERVLYTLIDDAALILHRLNKGRLRANSKKMSKITGKAIKFQYNTIQSIHIFDRPMFCSSSTLPKEVHDQLADYYELFDRFHIIETKSKDLLHMYHTYLDLSNKKAGYRLYMLEVFLLSLFPLKYLFGHEMAIIIHKMIDFFQMFFM